MGANERVTVQVDAIGNFSSLMGEVGKFRTQLQNLKLPDKITNKLEKGFDNVEAKVSHFQSLLNKGITTKGDFSKLVSSARAADKAIADLKQDVRSIGDKDLHIAVANSAEIQKAEQALSRLINAGEKLKNFGTTKGTGLISESEVSKMQKLASSSDGLKKKFQDVSNAFKTGNIEQANAAIEKLIAHVQRYQTQMNNSKATPGKGDEMLAWATGVKQALTSMVSEVDRAKASFNQLQANKFDQMKSSINGISTGLTTATNGVRQFINAETEAAARTNQLNEQVGHLRTQANYFFGLQNMGRLIARGIREAAESVRDLDKAMTETAVVTDFSVSDMWNMLPEYTALANKLGATTQGAYETMTLYFQQGLNKQQTFEIGEETMKMARIAGLDYAQTTNMMTAALRGFNMELNQTSAKRVNDVYSELAAITASDTRELGLAMERTASIAHSAGMDFGNTTAFLAQMIETTREAPENLGTAMKTIVARFQELKKSPYEISEVEGEEVDYNRVDKALKSIGVDLMDNRDKFRDLDDVFMDISERWDGLSQTTQRYIATMAAGSRQQSRFLAMVQNYDRLKQLTEAAANSEGASEVQFAKTLESYEAKVNKLKNAWQQYTMSLANNQAIKKTVDWLKDLITFGNKIIKTFGKIGGVFGDFGQGLAEMAASFGLGALGFKGLRSGANLGLRLLGGMTVKGATAESGMFPGGGRNSGIAAKISNPIVNAINRLTSVVSGQANKTDAFRNAQIRNGLIKERQNNLFNKIRPIDQTTQKRTRATFSATDVRKEFSGLTKEEQARVYKGVPTLRRALQNGYAKAYKGLNIDEAGQEALTKHFKQIDNAVKSGKISASEAFRHLYNPASVAQAIDNPEVTRALGQAVEQQMKSWDTQKHAKISARLKQMADSQGLEGDARQQFYQQQKRLIAGQELGISGQSTAQLTKMAGAMTAISSKATMAGQSVMGLGMALDSIGMHGAGSALMTVGNGLIGIGMAADGATAAVEKLKTAFSFVKANPVILLASAIAGVGIGINVAHKKMVKDAQKTGKKIVNTYKDTIDKTEKELNKLSDYEANWSTWAAGVDENGNNISLGTGEYEDYLKAVKEITQAHPELIKGYNAVGNAIVDNNTVLKEAKKLNEEEANSARETYLNSYEEIKTRQKSTKRWQKANEGGGLEHIAFGKAAIPTYKVQAQEALDALRQIKGADKILKDFGITWDETGNITEQGIELIRTKGNDLVNSIKASVGDSDKELNKLVTNASDKVATFGKTIKGLEDVSKDTYDWGLEYASSKGYDKIESGLIAPFQTAIERLAEKGLDEDVFKNQIDIIGQKYKDLGGHLKDFQAIQEEVNQAQKELGETANFDAYEDTVEVATAQMDGWIAELRSSTDEADHILAEWLTNQKAAMLEYSKNAADDLSMGLNQDQNLFKSASEASKRYETIKEEITDYASGINSAKAILDDAMTDQNLEGNGSLSFEQASISILGEDFVRNNAKNMDKVKAQMKDYQGWLQDSEGNARSMEETFIRFGDHIAKKLGESTEEIEGLGGPLSDFFTQTENGIEINSKRLSELTDEQMAILAEKGLDMSVDWMSGMLNIGRQLGYYSSASIDLIKQGLIEQNGQGAAVGKDSTIYKRKSDFEQESTLAGNSLAETEDIKAKAAKEGIELIGDVSSMTGKSIKNMMDNLDVSGEKSGKEFGANFVKQFEGLNYNRDEVSEAIDKALTSDAFTEEEKTSLQEAQANLTEIWDNILQDREYELGNEDKSAEERTASAAEGIESMLGQSLAQEGKLSKEAYTDAEGKGLGYNALKTVLGGKGQDTLAQFFASGKDRAGNTLSDEQFNAQLSQLQNLRKYYAEQESLMRTNAANVSGADKEWWTQQADYSKQALDYLDQYIQKGQEAHQEKLQQDKAEEESDNQKTDNKIANDNKETESEQTKLEEQEDKNDIKSETTDPRIERLGQLQEKFNALNQQEPLNLARLFGLSETDFFSEEALNFSNLISSLNLSQEQVTALGTALQGLNPGDLQNLDSITLSNLLNQLNLTEEQIKTLDVLNPDLHITATADTSEADTAVENIEAETAQPKVIEVITNVVDNVGQVAKQAAEQAQSQGSTTTNNITLQSTITNPNEPKEKIDAAMPTDYQTTVNATITMNASIKTGNLGRQMQTAASNASKGLKVSAGTTSTVTAKTKGTGDVAALNTAIKNIKGTTVNIKANVTGLSQVNNLKSAINALPNSKTITINVKKNGNVPKMAEGHNNYISHRSPIQANSLAKGATKRRESNSFRGGLTLTGEEGFEIAWLPSQNRSMILGAKGPQMVDLPRDVVVWNNEQSKKIIKQKAIPAKSMRSGTIPTSSSPSSSTNNVVTNTAKTVTKNSKKVAKAATDTAKNLGYVSVWWENIARKTEATQRKMDNSAKAFEKYIKEMRATLRKTGQSLASGGGGGDAYIANMTKYIGYNQAQINKATAELKQLDKGTKAQQQGKKGANKSAYNSGAASAVKISYSTGKKKKKTKEEIVNTAGYIKEQDGTYVIDQAKLNKVKNVEKRQALKDALEKEINDRLSKKYTAEDNIQKAQEALEKMGEELYKTFFAWENELTRIWTLTKQIELSESNISRVKEYEELISKQIASGMATATKSFQKKSLGAFQKEIQQSVDKLKERSSLIDEQKNAVNRAFSVADEKATLSAIQAKLKTANDAAAAVSAAADAKSAAESRLNSAKSKKTTAESTIKSADAEIASLKKQKKKTKKKKKKKNIQKKIDAAEKKKADAQKTLKSAEADIKKYQSQVNTATATYNNALNASKGTLNATEKLGYENYAKELQDKIDAQAAAQKYLKVTKNADGTVKIDFDTNKFEADKDKGLFTEERGKAIQDYVKGIQDASDELSKTYQTITSEMAEMYDTLTTLEDEWAEYANELWDISDAEIKKETENTKKLSDSISNALKKLLDEVKNKLDERRKQEDNAKKETEISQKQQRLAALQADTSGGHQVEIAQLQKEIADAQQDYQRSLEDQLLEKMQQQADLAEQQRQRQIELQEAIAEGVNNAALVNAWMDNPEAYRNEIYEAFKTANEYDKKPEALQEQLDRKFEELMLGLTTNQDKQEYLVEKIDGLQGILNQIQQSIDNIDVGTETKSIAQLEKAGYNYEQIKNAGYDAAAFKKANVSYANAKAAGFSLETLSKAGYTEADKEIAAAKAAAAKPATSTAKPTNTTPKSTAPTKVSQVSGSLKKGSKDSAGVKLLQKALNALGFKGKNGKKLSVDGDFGKNTDYAVKKFQKKYGLAKDGVVGPKTKAKFKALGYKTGGLADYTGPAWLHGSTSKPELVLNAEDTKNFLALRDVLTKAFDSGNAVAAAAGTAYEININVDHLNNDYDVDRVAERVKKIIVKDAGYRNVTQVRNFR